MKFVDEFGLIHEIESSMKPNQLPAEDVRQVVTCSKCKHGLFNGIDHLCDLHSGHEDRFGEDKYYKEWHYGDWFCADGDRKR